MGAPWAREVVELFEFVRLCIMGLVIKAKNDWRDVRRLLASIYCPIRLWFCNE